MTEHLAGLFGSAVGMLPSSPARSFELFTEITNLDETACDAWVGRIRCGDTDRVTLFRAWYSRTNFGQLAGCRRDLDEQPQRQGPDRRACSATSPIR